MQNSQMVGNVRLAVEPTAFDIISRQILLFHLSLSSVYPVSARDQKYDPCLANYGVNIPLFRPSITME